MRIRHTNFEHILNRSVASVRPLPPPRCYFINPTTKKNGLNSKIKNKTKTANCKMIKCRIRGIRRVIRNAKCQRVFPLHARASDRATGWTTWRPCNFRSFRRPFWVFFPGNHVPFDSSLSGALERVFVVVVVVVVVSTHQRSRCTSASSVGEFIFRLPTRTYNMFNVHTYKAYASSYEIDFYCNLFFTELKFIISFVVIALGTHTALGVGVSVCS